jgi:hypothetical protein
MQPLGDLLVEQLFSENGAPVEEIPADVLVSRLMRALAAVVSATGEPGREALQQFCQEDWRYEETETAYRASERAALRAMEPDAIP